MDISVRHPLSCIIADHHEICRNGIDGILRQSAEGVTTFFAATREDMLALLRKTKCSILFIGICHTADVEQYKPGSVRRNFPKTKIIGIIPPEHDQAAPALANAGVHGMLSKDTTPAEMKKAIEKIIAGHIYIAKPFESAIANRIVSTFSATSCEEDPPVLNDIETKLLHLIYNECKNEVIADHLGCGVKNVEYHRKKLYEKFKVDNPVGLTKKTIKFRMLGEI